VYFWGLSWIQSLGQFMGICQLSKALGKQCRRREKVIWEKSRAREKLFLERKMKKWEADKCAFIFNLNGLEYFLPPGVELRMALVFYTRRINGFFSN